METENIDLRRILRILKRRFWVIVLVAILLFAASGFYTFFIVDEKYEANTLLYVWQETTDSGAIQYNDLMMYSQLVNDYQVLAKSRLVTDQVVKELGLDPSVSQAISNKITVGTKNNTRHLTITVSDRNPEFAAVIANAVADVFSRLVVEKMGAANVQIIDRSIAPVSPASPNKPLNLAIGLLIGIMAGVLLAFAIEFFDVSVNDAEDIEAVTDFAQLGVIPDLLVDSDDNRRSKR